MIRIRSKQHNFRRAGMKHPAEPVDYPDEAFTPEQLDAIASEPMLVVEFVKDKKAPEKPAEPPTEDADKPKKGAK